MQASTEQPPIEQLPVEWLPEGGEAPEQLVLLLHGWAEDATAMLPLAQALRSTFPKAAVLAPDAPEAADPPQRGRQWYSIEGLTPQNWPQRVDDALPALLSWVRAQQRRLGVGAAATALGGFSQGAVLALAAALQVDGLVGRVLAFGGSLSVQPVAAPRLTTVHLFHGSADRVIPADGSRQALRVLGELRGDATLDVAEGVGHTLHPALIDCAVHRLTHHIPLRTWQEALGAVPHAPARAD